MSISERQKRTFQKVRERGTSVRKGVSWGGTDGPLGTTQGATAPKLEHLCPQSSPQSQPRSLPHSRAKLDAPGELVIFVLIL